MQQNKLSKFLLYFISILFLMIHPQPVAGVNLPSGLIIGDDDGVFVEKNGEYVIDINDMQPGVPYHKEITIRNTDTKEPFFISILSAPKKQSGSINLAKEISVVMREKGSEEILYKGNLLGNKEIDWTKTPVDLGTVSYEKEMVIETTFELSKDLTNKDFQEDSEIEVGWVYIARKDGLPTGEKTPPKGETPKQPSPTIKKPSGIKGLLPQTGEEWKNFLYKISAGLFILLIVLIIWKHRRDRREETLL